MKVRRLILGSSVIACLVVLILGMTGVFTLTGYESGEGPDGTEEGVTDVSKTRQAHAVMKGFEAKGERPSGDKWVLRAPRAEGSPETGMKLFEPKLEITRKTEDLERRVKIVSDRGTYREKKKKYVEMFGNVRLDYSGKAGEAGPAEPGAAAKPEKADLAAGRQDATLLTDSLAIDLDDGTGRTDADVEVTATTKEGRHVLTGTGAEFVLKDRVAQVFKNIRVEGSGGTLIFTPSVGEAKTPAAPAKTIVTCKGPCTADGFKRTIVLENDVVIVQGEDELRALKVVALASETDRTYDRITASGNVRFKVAGSEGTCDRLTHIAAEDLVIVEGSAASIRQEASEIRTRRLEMHARGDRLFAPVEGRLTLTPPAKKAGKRETPVVVEWSRSMRFHRAQHNAVFRGDIRFAHMGQTIQCQVLNVKFDEKLRDVVEVRAQEDVRVDGRIEDLLPPKAGKPKETGPISARAGEMVYLPAKQRLVLSEKAELNYSGQIMRGGHIEIRGADAQIRVTGPGSLQTEKTTTPEKEVAPVTVAWTGEMQFSRASQKAVFRRDVKMVSGGKTAAARDEAQTIECQALTVMFDKNLEELEEVRAQEDVRLSGQLEKLAAGKDRPDGERSPIKASCNRMRFRPADESAVFVGDVTLDYAGQVMRGQHIEIEGATGIVRAKGAGSLDAQQATEQGKERLNVTWGGRMQFDRSSGRAVFRHDVAVAYGKRKLRADTLTAKVGKANSLEGIEAEGDTILEEGESIARGDRLVWNMEKDLAKLTGSPAELEQGDQILFGNTIEFRGKMGRVRITSDYRVEGRIKGSRGLKEILPGRTLLTPLPSVRSPRSKATAR